MGFRYVIWALTLAAAQAPPAPLTLREETCRVCYRSCPISCFTGTCGLSYGAAVNRFGTSNSCWTCDQSASVGISRVGDFAICTPDESAATDSYIKKKDAIKGPWGSAIPGDARAAAKAAETLANSAMESARGAAEQAEKAAQAAVAQYNDVNLAAGKDGDVEQLAEAHRLAETIRAQEAEQAARAAEEARKLSEQQYQDELEKLRQQEIKTEHAEDIVARAEKAAEDARSAATNAAAKAAEAAREAAVAGASAAGRAAQQAEADELASAARAAQRRAIVAATAAKSAADKAGMAGSLSNLPPQPTGAAVDPCAEKIAEAVAAAGGTPPPTSMMSTLCSSSSPATTAVTLASTGSAPAETPAVLAGVPALPPAPVLPTFAADESAPGLPSSFATDTAASEDEDVSPLMPTLLPLPVGAKDDDASRMANAVVASLSADPMQQMSALPTLPSAPMGFGAPTFVQVRESKAEFLGK